MDQEGGQPIPLNPLIGLDMERDAGSDSFSDGAEQRVAISLGDMNRNWFCYHLQIQGCSPVLKSFFHCLFHLQDVALSCSPLIQDLFSKYWQPIVIPLLIQLDESNLSTAFLDYDTPQCRFIVVKNMNDLLFEMQQRHHLQPNESFLVLFFEEPQIVKEDCFPYYRSSYRIVGRVSGDLHSPGSSLIPYSFLLPNGVTNIQFQSGDFFAVDTIQLQLVSVLILKLEEEQAKPEPSVSEVVPVPRTSEDRRTARSHSPIVVPSAPKKWTDFPLEPPFRKRGKLFPRSESALLNMFLRLSIINQIPDSDACQENPLGSLCQEFFNADGGIIDLSTRSKALQSLLSKVIDGRSIEKMIDAFEKLFPKELNPFSFRTMDGKIKTSLEIKAGEQSLCSLSAAIEVPPIVLAVMVNRKCLREVESQFFCCDSSFQLRGLISRTDYGVFVYHHKKGELFGQWTVGTEERCMPVELSKIAPQSVSTLLYEQLDLSKAPASSVVSLEPMGGIYNVGRSCFLSATLQALSSMEFIRVAIVKNQHLSRLLRCLSEFLSDPNRPRPFEPTALYNEIKQSLPSFGKHQEEDAAEFYTNLLNVLQRTLPEIPNPFESDPLSNPLIVESSGFQEAMDALNSKPNYWTVISQFHGGCIAGELECGCGRRSVYDPFLVFNMSLPMHQESACSIQSLLGDTIHSYFDHFIQCSECGVPFQRTVHMNVCPQYLVLCLKRFDACGSKNKQEVEVSLDLWVEESRYSLISVINHSGRNCSSGHYTCHRRVDRSWFLFNDSKCHRNSSFSQTECYVLFYLLSEPAQMRAANPLDLLNSSYGSFAPQAAVDPIPCFDQLGVSFALAPDPGPSAPPPFPDCAFEGRYCRRLGQEIFYSIPSQKHFRVAFDLYVRSESASVLVKNLVEDSDFLRFSSPFLPSLRDVLQHREPLSDELLLKVARSVMSAIACLHEHRYYHGQIEPGNIFFHEENCLLGVPRRSPVDIRAADGVPCKCDPLYDLRCLADVLLEMLVGRSPVEVDEQQLLSLEAGHLYSCRRIIRLCARGDEESLRAIFR